jgi:hypothetical protein
VDEDGVGTILLKKPLIVRNTRRGIAGPEADAFPRQKRDVTRAIRPKTA